MAIGTLQRAAFETSGEFNAQTNGVIRETALYRSGLLNPADETTPEYRARYAALVREPGGYGFVAAIVADNAWNLTYDAWANDPESQKPVIEAAVQNVWPLLTGIE